MSAIAISDQMLKELVKQEKSLILTVKKTKSPLDLDGLRKMIVSWSSKSGWGI